MFKKAIQRGRKVKPAPEAYPVRYVEDNGEPRTKLGAFFNIVSTGEDDDR
jgi:hypothetical protein